MYGIINTELNHKEVGLNYGPNYNRAINSIVLGELPIKVNYEKVKGICNCQETAEEVLTTLENIKEAIGLGKNIKTFYFSPKAIKLFGFKDGGG